MMRISAVALILLVTHFYRYSKYKDEYKKNFKITSGIVLLIVIMPSLTDLVDSRIFTNGVIALLVALIPLYFYFERPMYRKVKEIINQDIMDRGSEYKKNFE